MTQSEFSRLHLTRGYATALGAAALLSTTAILIRYLTLTYALPPLILAFWRDLLVVLTLVPILVWLQPALLRVGRRHIPYLVAYGLVLSLFNVSWTFSVALNGAAVATVLCYCSAAFTALLDRWLFRERLGGVKLAAVGLSLIGCALVAGAFTPTAWHIGAGGAVVGTLTGLSYAVYSLMGRSAAQRGISPWTTLCYTFASATLFLLGFNLLSGRASPTDFLWLGKAWSGWGVLFLLAAGPTVAGFGLYNVSLSHLPSSVANLIATSEPVFTAVSAYLLLGERLNGAQLIGCAMIILSVVALRLYEGRIVYPETRSSCLPDENRIK